MRLYASQRGEEPWITLTHEGGERFAERDYRGAASVWTKAISTAPGTHFADVGILF